MRCLRDCDPLTVYTANLDPVSRSQFSPGLRFPPVWDFPLVQLRMRDGCGRLSTQLAWSEIWMLPQSELSPWSEVFSLDISLLLLETLNVLRIYLYQIFTVLILTELPKLYSVKQINKQIVCIIYAILCFVNSLGIRSHSPNPQANKVSLGRTYVFVYICFCLHLIVK